MIRVIDKNQVLRFAAGLAVVLFAVWLLSPFIKINAADYAHAGENIYRLALGILILLFFLGKLAFDIFFPQGIAKRVSNFKTSFLVVYSILVIGFILYIIAQAAIIYIQTSSQTDQLTF
ncbi:MAG: hypothetical protein WCC06_11060 [Candidatus Aminicenantales bacterium]